MDIAEQVAILLDRTLTHETLLKYRYEGYYDCERQIAVTNKKWIDEYAGGRPLIECKEKKIAFYKKKEDDIFVTYHFDGATIDIVQYDAIATLGIKKVLGFGKQGPVFIMIKDDVYVSIAPTAGVVDNEFVEPLKVITLSEYNTTRATITKKLKGSDLYKEILKRLKQGYKTNNMDGLR